MTEEESVEAADDGIVQPSSNTNTGEVEGGGDARQVFCIIRDLSTNTEKKLHKAELSFPSSMSAVQFMDEVSKRFEVNCNDYDMALQRVEEADVIILNDKGNLSLSEVGFKSEDGARNKLVISDKILPRKRLQKPLNGLNIENLKMTSSVTINLSDDGEGSTSVEDERCENSYVGLVNQASTCYLNSLLQILFMTPEFRNALYNYEYDRQEGDGVKCIPYQLQKLFLQLQMSDKKAVETTHLTRSFGWDSSEVWHQHDVQELCRVMFDALEYKFKGTDQADLINCLYQGKIKDYVKCLECGSESAREDSYLDIPLNVRPYSSEESYGSIEESLKAFVQPETLDGSNQYFCQKCDKKCNAHKGLKFKSFPYLLTLHLKRFDYNYDTMARIKLNDRLSFPEVLNLNDFVGDEVQDCHSDDGETTDSGVVVDYDISEAAQNDGDAIDVIDKLAKMPYSYELFSIMIHSGSANGGHYYAYIKVMDSKKWYSFNDQRVTRISKDDIERTYGSGGLNSTFYSSSTNAYMLMYRQIDRERNKNFVVAETFPEHIKLLQQSIFKLQEERRIEKEKSTQVRKVKFYCFHPTTKKMMECWCDFHKDSTLADTNKLAYQAFALQDEIPLEQCRLIKYDGGNESIICSFEDSDDKTVDELMMGGGQYQFLLETRAADSKFECYKPGGTTVKINIVNVESDTVLPSKSIRGHLTQTVREFRQLVAKELGVDEDIVRLALDQNQIDYKFLDSLDNTLKDEGFYTTSRVFVEASGSGNSAKPCAESRFDQILDRYVHTVSLFVTLPKLSEDILDRLASMVKESHNMPSETNGCKIVPLDVERMISIDSKASDEPSNVQDWWNGQNVHSDQSEDSSLTDSDRTVVGDNVSPEPLELDSAIVENGQSLESLLNSSISNSPQDDPRDLSSPELNSSIVQPNNGTASWVYTTIKCLQSNDQNLPAKDNLDEAESDVKRFFRASPFTDTETNNRMLKVHVDKRIMLGAFKKELEPYVGVSIDQFKVYRVYSNSQEFECTRLGDNLMSYGDDCKIIVKLGRALRKGECRVKIYQLAPDKPEPINFLIYWIFSEGMSVLEAKKEILPEIKKECSVDIPLERCRLRKKCWKNPGTIFLDSQKFDEDISIFSNWEVFLEVLPGIDPFTESTQLAIFTRRWRPSQYKVDALQEVILNDATVAELKKKLSEISGIEESSVEIAKQSLSTFPCDVSVLSIDSDLDWNPVANSLTGWPLFINDGHVLYYRDKNETLKQLSEEEKSAMTKTGSKLTKSTRIVSTRKEKALKIYTGSSASS